MNARKVKVKTFRVIDGIDPWEDLESQIAALEKTARKPPTTDGDDAAAVTTASDDDAKTKYLDEAAERIRKAVANAQKLGNKEKQIAADQAARAIERARDLQRALVMPTANAAYSAAQTLDKAEQAAKDLVPWYLAIGGVMWVAIGVAVFVIYEAQKKGGPRVARAIVSRGRSEVRA
jgi:benzoyl-CoA reductase/2-hydroxyglutaryl-CoA dehydratase subunit BcrC/BadD/HgdB